MFNVFEIDLFLGGGEGYQRQKQQILYSECHFLEEKKKQQKYNNKVAETHVSFSTQPHTVHSSVYI